MSRLIVGALVAAALLALALAGTAGAATWQKQGGSVPLQLRPAPAQQQAGRVGFVPLVATLTGTAQLSGHVLEYSTGSPLFDADVGWWVGSADDFGSGRTTTGYDGVYTLSSVAPASGNGGVWAAPSDGSYELDYIDRTWADASISTYEFHPGIATMQLVNGGVWDVGDEAQAWVTITGADAGGGLWAFTDDQAAGTAHALGLPGTYTEVCVNFWSNEGVELPANVTVTADAETPSGLTFDQASSQRLWEVFNYTASGDPGTVVKLRMQNFPAGEVIDFYGYQYEPVMTPYRSFGSYTAQDVANQYRRVTIPSTARVGQDYVIIGDHRGHLLELKVYFQVTRLKGPSSARGSYRLTGKVPIQSYDGSAGDTGGRKYVYLFRRFTSAAQPKGDPTKHGWKFMRRYRTDNTGKFTTYSMNPGRTAWYVVYYPDDTDNWDGFTSVRRVRHS